MRIKEVEQRTGLTRKAIRYYEESGLIKVEKENDGYKNYLNQHVDELMKIKQLRLLDLSIPEIGEYLNSKDRKSILEKKISENEEHILEAKERIRLVKKLLNGESIETIDFEKELHRRKKEQFRFVKINFGFGLANLLALLVVCLGYYGFDMKYNMGFAISVQVFMLIVSLRWDDKKHRQAKQIGQLVITRSRLEMIFKLFVNISTYVMAAGFIKNLYQYVGKFDWFNTMGNILIIVMYSIGMGAVVILSFSCSTKESMEYVK